MRRKGSISSLGYRIERRNPQPRDLRPHRSQSEITTKPTTGPTPIEQRGESEQKGGKKPMKDIDQ